MRDSDESLLNSFSLNRDEAAFRALAERYLGLVFHTALRRTNNRPLAEEVSQNILCALAKKAPSLAKNPDLLPAWLHRATLYESSKAMRSESSYQRRKQLQHSDAISDSNSPWSDAVPHLDRALDKLPESDRSLLLLHYFENRPFPKIAQTLGKNPAALQKQSQRALEKLSRILRSKGVTLSAAVLATGLTGELAKAAPTALLKSATAAVLSGSATYSSTGLTLMFATKSKVFIPLVALLCAAPLVLQQVAISNARNQNDALRSKLSLADSSTSQITQRRNMTAARGSGVSSNLDILVLVDEQAESRRAGGLRQIAFTEKLAALPQETLVRLIGEGAVLRIQRDKKTGILNALVSVLAEKDARLAVTSAIAAFPAGPELQILISNTSVAHRFATWADSDPVSALGWYREQEESGKFNPDTLTKQSGAITEFRAPMIRALVGNDDSQAIAIFESAHEEQRLPLLVDVLRTGGLTIKPAASELAIRCLPLVREGFPDEEPTLQAIGNSLAPDYSGGLPEAARFLNAVVLSSHERDVIIRAVADSTLGMMRHPLDLDLEARIDSELRDWLQVTAPQVAETIIEDARAKASAAGAKQADYIIKCLRETTDLTDRKLSSDLMNYDFRSRRREALELAGKIEDSELRATTVDFLDKR